MMLQGIENEWFRDMEAIIHDAKIINMSGFPAESFVTLQTHKFVLKIDVPPDPS